MNTRRLFQTAVIGVTLALAGCIAATYLVVRTKTLDATAIAPFDKQIGRDLALKQPVRLVRTRSQDVLERPWRMMDNPQQDIADDEPPATAVPAGTRLRFDAARPVRGGVSGNTTPVLLGHMDLGAERLAFEFIWGERRYMDGNDVNFGPPLRFSFPQAPWQTAPDPLIYSVPEP